MEMSSTNLLWFLAFVFLAGGNGFSGLFGNNRIPMGPPPATQAELTAGLNNQSIMNELNALGLATANNNYESARLISDQNLLMQSMNNTNNINVIQGFLTNFLRPFYFADLRRNSMWFIFENDLKKQVIPTVFLHRELFIPTGFSASQRSTNRCLAWCR